MIRIRTCRAGIGTRPAASRQEFSPFGGPRANGRTGAPRIVEFFRLIHSVTASAAGFAAGTSRILADYPRLAE